MIDRDGLEKKREREKLKTINNGMRQQSEIPVGSFDPDISTDIFVLGQQCFRSDPNQAFGLFRWSWMCQLILTGVSIDLCNVFHTSELSIRVG